MKGRVCLIVCLFELAAARLALPQSWKSRGPGPSLNGQTEVSRRLIIVQLYKALGGGWNLTDPQWVASAPTASSLSSATKH